MAPWIKGESLNKLILIRHGQSTYNLENKFTGWKDVELTNKGIDEAEECSELLKDLLIDKCFTSNLVRAQNTLSIILNKLNQNPQVVKNEALNERDYGDLIGKNKAETAKKYGDKQVEIWRRSYDTPPPNGESLKMTCERVLPYFENVIMQDNLFEKNNSNILISAHGNSIRAIVMHLFNLSPKLILKTEIGWCEPWVFTFDKNIIVDFNILTRKEESNSKLPIEFNFQS